MLCPNCKTWELLEDDEFCSWCRHSVAPPVDDKPQIIVPKPPIEPEPPPLPPPPPPRPGWIWALVLIVIAAAGAFAFYKWPRSSPPPKIETFSADHDTIANGQSFILRWSVSGVKQVKIDPFGVLPAQGEQTVSPTQTSQYQLTAENPGGTALARIEVRVEAPPEPTPTPSPSGPSGTNDAVAPPEIESFSSDRSSITRGDTVDLRFAVTGATKVSIEPGIGEVPAGSTSVRVSPNADTGYILIAENSAWTSKTNPLTIQVKEPSPVIEFSGDARQIDFGRTVQLRWRCRNTTTVRIEPGFPKLDAEGSVTVTPGGTSEYKLIAEGPGGTASETWTVRVDPRIISFDSFPIQSKGCDFAILRWKVDGAAKISIDHGIGDVTAAPWFRVRPTQPTDYALTAERPGGAARKVWAVPAYPASPACPF